MPLKCKHCNEDSFDVEDQVCKSCGIVGNEIQFGIETNVDLSFKPFHFQSPKSRKSKNCALNQGIKDLTYLCHHFNVPSDIKMEASNLLTSVYSNQRAAGKSFRLKEDVSILAGCCIMKVQARHNGTMTVNSLCAALQCSKKKVNKMLKILNCYLFEHSLYSNPENDSSNLDDCVQDSKGGDLESLKAFVTSVLANFPKDIQSELINKTVLLTKLADSCWLLTGRSRLGVVSAAAFLCWKFMNPNLKLSLEQFCSCYCINKSKARARVPELKDMLLKLGRNIPSKAKNYVNEKNILFHLGYILENSESLRNDLLVEEFTGDGMSKKEYDIFRSCYSKKTSEIEYCPEVEENIVASDIEISDTEISSYIRTKEQIGLIENIRNLNKCEFDLEK